MNILILSDLHNEFLKNKPDGYHPNWSGSISITEADVVVLAGDIDIGTNGVEWAIKESKRLEKPIIYVAGNHEYYKNELNSIKEEIHHLTRNTEVSFLDPGVVEYEYVRFIGATLWTDYKVFPRATQSENMNAVGKALRDHIDISICENGTKRYFTPEDALALHEKDLEFIINELEKPFTGKTVVVTHHGPHVSCQHKDFNLAPISTGFHSDLSRIIDEYPIDVWIYGHTHSNMNEKVGNTQIISNQAGYPREYVKDFDSKFMIFI